MTETAAQYIVTPNPCPSCGSNRLDSNFWIIDHEEVDALECADCKAGAPLEVWNRERDPFGFARLPKLTPEESAAMNKELHLIAQDHLEICKRLWLTPGWHYPKNNDDLANMPAPGEIVVLFYEGEDGQPVGPVICTPVHAEGLHIVNGKNIYRRCIRWHEIPDEECPNGIAY
jgi:hypothetical protein